ncbi:hypothetical protein G7Z17_g8083 [Cylindrodendrum hubeiense]|uniref:Ankyrin n=1 Tax=Cylindrodendrum hubeiense TaxID=595255 RepID=A0A9P5H1U1_9HYPO|nr:hypothetical protein G7Z17_g8083 [Cylindrodendrum hubeiense]
MSAQTLPTPPTAPPPPVSSEEPVPTYSATDEDSLFARIEQTTALNLPILHAPAWDLQAAFSQRLDKGEACGDEYQACCLTNDIVDSFFASIKAGRDDLVADFVSRGLVSPDVTSHQGETPLLAAVRMGKTPMVSRLVALGATVNAFGASLLPPKNDDYGAPCPKRTPLMMAAETGHLALVKVLMEDYGADDSLVAPDGAIALRLAATNGHRDIVRYLPSRRAGSWLRWKTAHEKEMKRMYRAIESIISFLETMFWTVPKFLVYDIPKSIGKSLWKRRHKVAEWCKRCKDKIVELPAQAKRFAVKLPSHVKYAAKQTWEGIKQIPPFLARFFKAIWKVIKEIPHVVKEISLWVWRGIKAIPGVVKTFLLWIGRGLKSFGEAIFNVFARFFSLLHTALSAIFSFFRGITLKDIWDGFCSLLRAIFIETPQAIFRFIKSFGQMTYDVLKGLFGTLGKLVWYIGAGIWYLINYIPRKLWECITAIGRSIRRAFQEMMAYLDPKRM